MSAPHSLDNHEIGTDRDRLVSITRAFRQARALHFFVATGLYKFFRTKSSLGHISKISNFDFRVLEAVTGVMYAIGVLRVDKSNYYLPDNIEKLLDDDSDSGVRDLITWSGRQFDVFARKLPLADQDLRVWANCVNQSTDHESICEAVQRWIPKPKRILDVAGGLGATLIKVVSSCDAEEGFLIERPPVSEFAQYAIGASPLCKRIGIIDGDFCSVAWPGEIDLVMCNNLLHVLDDRMRRELLVRCSLALRSGGWLFISGPMRHGHEISLEAACLDLTMALNGGLSCPSVGEICVELERCHFQVVSVFSSNDNGVCVVARTT